MTVYWSSPWARILNVGLTGYNYWKNQGSRQVYRQRVSLLFPRPSPVLANLVNTKHLYNICTMVDQRRRRCADVVKGDTMFCVCWSTSMQHNVPTQYQFNVCPASQPIAGSIQVNRFRRWLNIETGLGDCRCLLWLPYGWHFLPRKAAIRITRYNTGQLWNNVGPTLFQPKPFKLSCSHEYNREHLFSWRLFKTRKYKT